MVLAILRVFETRAATQSRYRGLHEYCPKGSSQTPLCMEWNQPLPSALWFAGGLYFSMKDELSSLPVPERALACKAKANELLAGAQGVVSPEIKDELVTIALQWLALAVKLESRRDAPDQD
jgi:hypothetical protein